MKLFSSELEDRIDRILSLTVIDDWGPVDDICRMANREQHGVKDAARSLRKRLRSGTPQQQMNAIALIQALIDGCGSKFKVEMASIKFSDDIAQVLLSNSTNHHIKARLMERLALWAADFKSDPSLRNITRLYRQMSAMNDVNPVLQLRVQIAGQPSTLVVNQVMTIEKRVGIIFQDIDLANTVAQMLNQAIAFANPEMEAVEENMLIKEFHTNAMRISQKLQVFISEVSAWENPNEACLCALLASNQDIMQALRSYDQIMEQCAIRTAIKLNHAVNECRAASDQGASTSLPLSPLKDDDKGDLELTLSAAGVGSVYTSLQSTVPQEKSTESAYQAAREEVSVPEPVDPFADDAYRITGAADIAAAIRSGKRKESAQKDDVVSQEEMDLIKMVEKHSLHSFPEQAGSSSGSSSSLLRSTSSSTPALIAQSIPIAAVPPVV